MNSTFFLQQIKEIAGEENVLLNEEMSKHTTFHVGGPADYFVTPDKMETAAKLIWYLNKVNQDYFVIGNGSNLLVGDKGYRGTIIKLGNDFCKINAEGDILAAGAGAMLSSAARFAADASLSGLEFAAGIPGSVGGALMMNAGAYGGDMSQVVISAEAITADGNILTLSNAEMKFGYRTSICRHEPLLMTEAKLQLKAGNIKDINDQMNDLAQRRRSKQPLEYPSAGSTFKRPEGFFAGKLIMDAGLSGMTIGGAKVSEKHCGFIINTGKATAADILDCIHEVQDKVQHDFHVELEPEVCILGEF